MPWRKHVTIVALLQLKMKACVFERPRASMVGLKADPNLQGDPLECLQAVFAIATLNVLRDQVANCLRFVLLRRHD